jgi:ferritin-like metal-binding protein YciE
MKNDFATPQSQQDQGTISENRPAHAPKSVHDLRTLFVTQVRNLVHAQRSLEGALTQLADQVWSRTLHDCISVYRDTVRAQVTRGNAILAHSEASEEGGHCDVATALVHDLQGLVNIPKGPVRDAATILNLQKIQHFKIATYGTLLAFAEVLGEGMSASILDEALGKEKQADGILTAIALAHINEDAAKYRYAENIVQP